MRVLRKVTLENIKLDGKNIYKRIAARGIILDGEISYCSIQKGTMIIAFLEEESIKAKTWRRE